MVDRHLTHMHYAQHTRSRVPVFLGKGDMLTVQIDHQQVFKGHVRFPKVGIYCLVSRKQATDACCRRSSLIHTRTRLHIP